MHDLYHSRVGDPVSPYAPLRLPNFRRYVLAVVAVTLAYMIQTTVVGWQVYTLTHDPLALGLVGLAEALPYIATSLYAGHVADRHDRRLVALGALTVMLAGSVVLAVLSRTMTSRPDVLVRSIYGITIVGGFARSFLIPARQALGAEVVPRDLFVRSVTWRSAAWQLAAVAGPALGGVIYAASGTVMAYAAAAILTGCSIVALLFVRPVASARFERAGAAMLDSLAAGVRFVFGERVILGALSLDLFGVLFGGATALLPVYAAEILHVGADGLGILRSAPAIGAVVMSTALTHVPGFRRTGRTLLACVALYGVTIVVFGLSTSFALSVAALIAGGAFDMVSVFIRSTLLTTRTPPDMLGRVMSVNGIFVGSSNEIGAFESGVTASWFGTVPAVVIGGALTLGVVAITAWRNPTLRRLGRLDTASG